MRKKLKWIALVVAVLIVVAIVGVVLSLDSIVKVAVQKGSTQQLQIPTTLDSAHVGLFSGDVSLSDYVVASPEGFSAPHMLSLGKLNVDTSYSKVFGDPVAVNSIQIDKPQLTLEFKGTRSNLKTLADKLAGGTGGDQPPTEPTKTEPTKTGEAKKPMKLIIDDLKISGAQITVISDLLGSKTFDVPAIEMQQIGNADGNKNGEEVGKVVSQVISRLSIEAEKSGNLPPELAAILNGDLGALTDKIGGQFKEQAQQLQQQAMQQVQQMQSQVEGKLNDAKSQAQEKANDLENQAKQKLGGLGGLLGGNKKEKANDAAK